jgi:hypothetical protein
VASRADGKQLCCPPPGGTAVETALAGSKTGFGRRKSGDLALKQACLSLSETGTGRPRPVPQKASRQPWF